MIREEHAGPRAGEDGREACKLWRGAGEQLKGVTSTSSDPTAAASVLSGWGSTARGDEKLCWRRRTGEAGALGGKGQSDEEMRRVRSAMKKGNRCR